MRYKKIHSEHNRDDIANKNKYIICINIICNINDMADGEEVERLDHPFVNMPTDSEYE